MGTRDVTGSLRFGAAPLRIRVNPRAGQLGKFFHRHDHSASRTSDIESVGLPSGSTNLCTIGHPDDPSRGNRKPHDHPIVLFVERSCEAQHCNFQATYRPIPGAI